MREECKPRIIVNCGHSVCQKCLQILLNGHGVCPQCKCTRIKGTIANYPLNQALIHILENSQRTPSVSYERKHDFVFGDEISQILPSARSNQVVEKQFASNDQRLCERHMTPYQAFCQHDLQLLCIDCLLTEHKSHKVLNLEDAAQKLMQKMFKASTQTVNTMSKNDKAKVQQETQFQAKNLSRIFDEIRAYVNDQELRALSQLKVRSSKQIAYIQECTRQNEAQIHLIEVLKKKYTQLQSQDDQVLRVLHNALSLGSLIQKSKVGVDYRPNKIGSIQFTRDEEISKLIKRLSSTVQSVGPQNKNSAGPKSSQRPSLTARNSHKSGLEIYGPLAPATRQNTLRQTKSPPSFQPSFMKSVHLQMSDKPPLPEKIEKITTNDHFVFSHGKSNSLVFPYQGGPGSRLENSFNGLNSSKHQTENSKVTLIEGDNDIIDLDSSNSVKSFDNPEIIQGPQQVITWTGEHSPVQFNPRTFENNGKDINGSGRKTMTPNPMFYKDGLTTQANQDLILVQSSGNKCTSGPDSKFGISQYSQSIDYEQLFKLKDDYIFSCDQKHMYMFNLKRQKQTIVEIEGGLLFAHKQQICRIHQLPNLTTQFTVASVDDLDFKPIGVIQTNIQETSCCKLQKAFTVLLSSKEKVISVKILKPKIKVSTLPSLNIPRTQHTVIQAADAQILVIGGVSHPEKIPLQSIEIYRLGLAEWQICNLILPIPLNQLSSVSHPEGVLLFGGFDSTGQPRKECYKVVGLRQIINISPLPIALQQQTCVSTPTFEEVYLMSEKQVFVYNTKKNFWSSQNSIKPHAAIGTTLVQF